MKNTLVTVLILLLLCPLFALVEETASLKNFMFGTEPNCQYDNWVSHIAEGIAYPGYNTYAPYDRQMTGFGAYVTPSTAQINAWESIIDYFLAGQYELAESAIATAGFPYQVVKFNDTDSAKTYYMLRELPNGSYVDNNNTTDTYDDEIGAFAYGWGLYIYNPDGTRPVVLTVPHPTDDFPTPFIGYEAFQLWDAKFLMITGAGREVKWTQVGTYNNSKSLSDPTRVTVHPYNSAYKKFADQIRAEFGITEFSPQFHSYDWNTHAGYAANQISAGNNKLCPNLPIRDLSSLKNDLINQGNHVMIPANTIGIHSDVYLNDYYAVNYSVHDFTFSDDEQEYAVNSNIDLPAYQYNQQMLYTLSGWNDYDTYEPFFHVEMDELPNCYELTENTYKWFYGWDENLQRWDYNNLMANFNAFYMRWVRDLESVMDDMFEMNDMIAPTTPIGLYVQNQSLTSITLAWTKTDSYDFDTYEILYATEPITESNYLVFSRDNANLLASADCQSITVTGLNNANNYFFKIRGKDKNGIYSGLSNEVTTIPAPANITSFIAHGMDSSVRLYWSVSGQVSNQGFSVYRKGSEGDYVLIDSYLSNPALSNSGANSFTWWDYNVVNGDAWTYMISSRNLNGMEFFYNYPASAMPLPVLNLTISNTGATMQDQISFAQNPFATDGQDNYFDVSKSAPSGASYVWGGFWEQYWGQNGTNLSREVKGGYNLDLDVKTWIVRFASTLTNQPLFINVSNNISRAEKLYLYDNGTGTWHNLANGPYQFQVSNTNFRTMTLHWGNVQPKIVHSAQANRIYQGNTSATFNWSNTNAFLIDSMSLYFKNATDSLLLADQVAGTTTSFNYTFPQNVDMQKAKFMIDVHAVDGMVTTYESGYTIALVPSMNLHFTEAGWQTRSSSWTNLNPTVETVFGTGATALSYLSETEWLPQTEFLYGTAYWVNSPDFSFYSSTAAVSTGEVNYSLQHGWNFVPNPHLCSYPLRSIRFTVNGQLFRYSEMISQKLISRGVFVYRNGSYVAVNEILPNESFFIKYYGSPSLTTYINFLPFYEAPEITPPTSNWNLTMEVSSGNSDKDSIVLGTNPTAHEEYDFRLDLPAAPVKPFNSLQTYISREAPEDISFLDSKLYSEFRSPFNATQEQEKIWNFKLVAPSADPITFTLTGLTLPAGYTFRIGIDNMQHNLADGNSFTFTPPAAGTYEGFVKVNNYPVSNADLVQVPVSALTVYPNPFNPTTTIAFYTPRSMELSVTLYNIKGQKVRNLHSGQLGMGNHQLVWDGKDDGGRGVSSGIYFARVNAGKYVQNVKMVLMK
jgi:hypothetical protein